MQLAKVYIFVGALGIIATQVFGNIYNDQLLCAAEAGDDQGVRDLANANGCDINVVSKTGYSPLMLACRAGHAHIVDELLKKKANVHIADSLGKTALLLAIEHGNGRELPNIEIVKKLIKAGACVDVCDRAGNSPLSWALSSCTLEVVQELIANGATLVKRVDPNASCDVHRNIPIGKQCAELGEVEYANDVLFPQKAGIGSRSVRGFSDASMPNNVHTKKISTLTNMYSNLSYTRSNFPPLSSIVSTKPMTWSWLCLLRATRK